MHTYISMSHTYLLICTELAFKRYVLVEVFRRASKWKVVVVVTSKQKHGMT